MDEYNYYFKELIIIPTQGLYQKFPGFEIILILIILNIIVTFWNPTFEKNGAFD